VIKAAGRSAIGQPVLFLGLSGENVTRLAAGEPIRITPQQMAELGLPQMEVVIHYGRTEQGHRGRAARLWGTGARHQTCLTRNGGATSQQHDVSGELTS
jgi:hypothetical protein